MKTVAILGGGPAGAFAAERLAAGGLRTIVFDEKLAWEKPCGGGLTYKAYQQYPFLLENPAPKKLVHETMIGAPNKGEAKMRLNRPLVIYSRFDLNQMLLDRAEKAGAELEKTRVLGIERKDRGWRLRTQHGIAEADFCVVATGARNSIRDVGTQWGHYRHDERAGLLRSRIAGSDRHSVSPQAGRLHLGVSALRASFRRHLRQGRAGARLAGAAGDLYGRAVPLRQGCEIL